ncbi:hypothetical protein B0H12DRAFT_1137240 [Mycena haematopus]|nr:hypothetical protein B0H12DRAFT_1137240 [Mycena haematopus]
MSLDNSPFMHRLNTNYVPSDSEILEIRAVLLGPENELARIDARLEDMESALAQLKEQRALLKRPIDAHRALISPLRRVSEDVLIEIFLSCLPSEHNALINTAEAPLILGRICRHWRSVAYSAPLLWRTIHIPPLDYSHMPPKILSRLETLVEEWLERSATCSLSLSLSDHLNSSAEAHTLVPRLRPFSRRLRHLSLSGDAELFRPLLLLGPEDTPLLKSLRMHCTSRFPDSMNIFQIPTLEEIALSIFTSVDPHSLPLPWSQLTRLRLECAPIWTAAGQEGGLNLSEAFNVLRRCPNLVQCEILITNGSGDVDFDTSPIILRHLRTLDLSGTLFLFTKWISHLVVPNLRFLRVGQSFPGTTARSLLRDGYMGVDIDLTRFAPSALKELFRSFPLISHLRLFVFHPEAGPLDNLLVLFGSPHEWLPILTVLTVLEITPTLPDATVLAFVKARMAMPTPLQKFRIQFNRPMKDDIMPELRPFISEGLQVDITYLPRLQWIFRPRWGLEILEPPFSH